MFVSFWLSQVLPEAFIPKFQYSDSLSYPETGKYVFLCFFPASFNVAFLWRLSHIVVLIFDFYFLFFVPTKKLTVKDIMITVTL